MCTVLNMVHIFLNTSTYKQIKMHLKSLADSIIIQFQLTQMSYIMKLISSLVKPSQLIFPSLILIELCNTSILVHTLSDIMCQSFILNLIDILDLIDIIYIYISIYSVSL